MISMVVSPITIRGLFETRLLLLDAGITWVVHTLVNFDVHLFNKDAVSRNSISLLDIN